MRYRIVANTPVGQFFSFCDAVMLEELRDFAHVLKRGKSHIELENEDGDIIILREDVVRNSVFIIEKAIKINDSRKGVKP